MDIVNTPCPSFATLVSRMITYVYAVYRPKLTYVVSGGENKIPYVDGYLSTGVKSQLTSS